MRLWTFHPKYLDRLGLLAQWREGLLGLEVIGTKRGYSNHSQLKRFALNKDALREFLYHTWEEGTSRGYKFDLLKLGSMVEFEDRYLVDKECVAYEWAVFMEKIKKRDPKRYISIKDTTPIELNPVFTYL